VILRTLCLTATAVAAPLVARGQQPNPDEVGAVRAAVEYYRDARLRGPIVIAVDSPMHRGPLVSSVVVDRVVELTGTKKGVAADHLACREEVGGGRKQQICEMRGATKAVLTLSELLVRNDTATLAVYYTKAPAGRLIAVEEALTLVKRPDGRWTVAKMRETGVS
jgi:hypothetical protein